MVNTLFAYAVSVVEGSFLECEHRARPSHMLTGSCSHSHLHPRSPSHHHHPPRVHLLPLFAHFVTEHRPSP